MMRDDPQSWKPDETPKNVFNPLHKDFTYEYRDENNVIQKLTVPLLQTSTYPTWQANNIIENLIDAVINEKNMGFVTPEKRAEIKAEIEP